MSNPTADEDASTRVSVRVYPDDSAELYEWLKALPKANHRRRSQIIAAMAAGVRLMRSGGQLGITAPMQLRATPASQASEAPSPASPPLKTKQVQPVAEPHLDQELNPEDVAHLFGQVGA